MRKPRWINFNMRHCAVNLAVAVYLSFFMSVFWAIVSSIVVWNMIVLFADDYETHMRRRNLGGL